MRNAKKKMLVTEVPHVIFAADHSYLVNELHNPASLAVVVGIFSYYSSATKVAPAASATVTTYSLP
jgi:hypothetical protein